MTCAVTTVTRWGDEPEGASTATTGGLGSIDIAIRKARTARYFDMDTGDLGKLSKPGAPAYMIEVSNGGLITFPGGVPLETADGEIVGAQIMATIPGSQRMCQFVRHHHERFDGGGYPDALKGEQIPLGARIIAVAEAYVDMMTDRPYANARPQNEAIDELESLAGLQFDGMVVRILVRQLRGDRVRSSGAGSGT